jgi:putative PIG3 family NAD(P)H quinone oxidoreductase
VKAIRITEHGGPEGLQIQEVGDPIPAPSEVLVEVKATALNRADLLQCLGMYPAPPGFPPDIPGLEYAGSVVSVGSKVTRWRAGDRVMGIVGGGAFAQKLVAHERECVPIPGRMAFRDAAAIPEAFFTAFDALVLQGDLRSGERALIHAVGSGVGTAATQVATALNATVLGTSRSQAKLDRCVKELGLSHPILCGPTAPRFAPKVKEITGGLGADLALELVGGEYFPETATALASRGRILLVGLLGGAQAGLDLRVLLSKRIKVIGTVLRSRPIEEKISLARAFEHQMLPLLLGGRLRPVVDSVFPAIRVHEAFSRMASEQSFGKVVLEW